MFGTKIQWIFVFVISFLSTTSHNVMLFHNMDTRSNLLHIAPPVQEILDRGHEVIGDFFKCIREKIRIEILILDHFTNLQKQASEKLMEKEVKALLTPSHGHGQKIWGRMPWRIAWAVSWHQTRNLMPLLWFIKYRLKKGIFCVCL